MREAGIENVERILELGEDKLKEIPGVGDKTAAKIMEAAKDLFEEVEIEVPEGMDLPTAIQAADEDETSDDEAASESDSETPAADVSADANAAAEQNAETADESEAASKAADSATAEEDEKE